MTMLTLSILFSVIALAAAGGVFFFLWGRGAFAAPVVNNPTVELPVLLITSDLAKNTKCADITFQGSVEVELIYLPSPNPNAEVKLTLEIRRKRKCTVDLASTDLGIFRNDMSKEINFSGELTDPCKDADFTVSVIAVNQGPGSTTMAEAIRVDINALPYTVTMPTHVSTTNGRDFNFEIVVNCCEDGPRNTIKFTNISGVHDLDATPNGFNCGSAVDIDTVTIKGKKDDENQVGSFTVKAESLRGDCTLGSVLVE
jgi:hypothetical protein